MPQPILQSTTFVQWMQSLPISWLVSGTSDSVADAGAWPQLADVQVDRLKDAVEARFPDKAPADALAHIGSERGLVQGGSIAGTAETNTAFATRLKQAWDKSWPYAGTPLAILLNLYYSLGYQNVAIVQQNGLVFRLTTPPNADPTTSLVITNAASLTAPATPVAPYTKTIPAGNPWWKFDDKTDFCSRFAVVITTANLPASWTSIVNPPTVTSAPTVSEVGLIRAIIQQWRNAEATCMGIYVGTTGKEWGIPESQIWQAATGNWGGTSTVFTP